MGALAGLLKEAGYEVVGVEGGPIYPPMSELLEGLKIPVIIGFRGDNPTKIAPSLAVIGNVIRRENPEAQAIFSQRIPYLSFPEALYGLFLRGKKSLVVAGTHGKSTTSALLAYSLEKLSTSPTFLVGGLLRDRGRNYALGQGPLVVLEGDEYDSAFFDKRPKFLHYAPYAAILTSVEFDHADIYPDLPALKRAFSAFVSLIPQEGVLVYWADSQVVSEVVSVFSGKKIPYGTKGDFRLLERFPSSEPVGQRVRILAEGEELEFFLPLIGEHNALNALAVFGLLRSLGFDKDAIFEAFSGFCGLRRRQEILLEDPVLVMDDFAHHPTAVFVTLKAVRETWPGRRVLAAFEPRTNTSRRRVFQEAFPEAFSLAEVVFLKIPPDLEKVPRDERLDLLRLKEDLERKGRKVFLVNEPKALEEAILGEIVPGDLMIFMSNGPFDGLPRKVAQRLAP